MIILYNVSFSPQCDSGQKRDAAIHLCVFDFVKFMRELHDRVLNDTGLS